MYPKHFGCDGSESQHIYPCIFAKSCGKWVGIWTLEAKRFATCAASKARFRLRTGVCKCQKETFADSCAGLRSLPPVATSEHFVSVLTTAAESVFGPPGTLDTVPGLVSAAARVLHALLKAHRRWWLTAPLVRKVVAARKAVRQVWEVVGLDRSVEVVPLARPGGVKGPAKSDYRRLLRKPYTARMEPTYVSGRLVPPELQAAVGLHQFRARHWRPILRSSQEELCAVVPWRVAAMPSVVVTIDSVKTVWRKAWKSTPFRDVIEYCMIEWLRDAELQRVVEFLQSVST